MGLEEAVTRLDVKEAAKYGVSLFPALIVDGKVVSEGKIRSVSELIALLGKA